MNVQNQLNLEMMPRFSKQGVGFLYNLDLDLTFITEMWKGEAARADEKAAAYL
jgi:hypothetical protein